MNINSGVLDIYKHYAYIFQVRDEYPNQLDCKIYNTYTQIHKYINFIDLCHFMTIASSNRTITP